MALKLEDVKKIVVIGGGGSMGHGIVLACIQNGPYKVTILSRRESTCQHGLKLIKNGPYGLSKAVKRGKISEEQAEEMFSRVSISTNYAEALPETDLIFESLPEEIEVKKQCFREAEKYIPDHCVIASGTSAIMISELAGALKNQGNLVGTHWFFPVKM